MDCGASLVVTLNFNVNLYHHPGLRYRVTGNTGLSGPQLTILIMSSTRDQKIVNKYVPGKINGYNSMNYSPTISTPAAEALQKAPDKPILL